MGSRGGNAPNPWSQRQVSTLFLRVPFGDWPRVKIGEKTEFRTKPREGARLLTVKMPTPVVAYTVSPVRQEYDAQIMVLEERRYEPLFAIHDDEAAIHREGFESYDEFRRYWRKRRKGVFRPMEKVYVWRVRRWEPHARDDIAFGLRLLHALYGEFLPPVEALR
jgi:hypothetical protein